MQCVPSFKKMPQGSNYIHVYVANISSWAHSCLCELYGIFDMKCQIWYIFSVICHACRQHPNFDLNVDTSDNGKGRKGFLLQNILSWWCLAGVAKAGWLLDSVATAEVEWMWCGGCGRGWLGLSGSVTGDDLVGWAAKMRNKKDKNYWKDKTQTTQELTHITNLILRDCTSACQMTHLFKIYSIQFFKPTGPPTN